MRSIRCLFLAVLLVAPETLFAAGAVHPLLRPLVESDDAAPVLPAPLRPAIGPQGRKNGDERIGVWICSRDGGRSLEAAGLLAPGAPGAVRHAEWTILQLRAAARDPNVAYLRPALRCKTSLDSSLVETLTDQTHAGAGLPPHYAGLTGAHVVVGIVDTGIDLEHDDFRDPGGKTRLVSLWDQWNASTTDNPRGFGYGKEWTAAQIDAGLADETDDEGHGTHVAGIVAGDGSATRNGQAYKFVGMAPGAALVVVKTDLWDTHIVDGVDYIFQKADSLGLPAVVNLSLGGQFGPHDGTDPFDLGISALTGPGRMVVAAAGNETGYAIHAQATVDAPGTGIITFSVPDYSPEAGPNNDWIAMDGWYTGGTLLSVSLITPLGQTIGPVEAGTSADQSTPSGHIVIDNATSFPSNGDMNLTIEISDDNNAGTPPGEGLWTIQAEAIPVGAVTATTELDIWDWYYSTGDVAFVDGVEEAELVGTPGTADSVIAVGAYVTKRSWIAQDGNRHGYVNPPPLGAIAPWSSVGPRRDGVMKPEVAAPGMGVASALSATAAGSFNPISIMPDSVHVVLQGTSMATPHVTGLIALMYQAWGKIPVREMIDKLTTSARNDTDTGALPNPVWGYGKIDALGATGYPTPVELESAEAVQYGDRVRVRFLLSEDAGPAPLSVWRSGPGDSERAMIGWSSPGPARAFDDSTLTEDGGYAYWLRADAPGTARWIGPARVRFERRRIYSLEESPNPFLATTKVRWRVPGNGRAVLSVHDIAGRRVRSLAVVGGKSEPGGPGPGAGIVVWDGSDDRGRDLPAGIYLIRLRGDDGRSLVRKVLKLD